MGGGNNNNDQLFGTKVNSSSYGKPYIAAMGTVQVPQSILWVDGFESTPAPSGKGSTGSGGKGGGSKSGQYLYSTDVVVALCNGPIQGIGDVWGGQSWLGSPKAAESYTITSPYTYTPTNATTLYNDLGVGVTNTYSSSNNDIGAPSPTVLSGSFSASMTLIPWYKSSVAYLVGNKVFNGTDVYTCILANTGVALSNATYWTNSGAGLTAGTYSINPTGNVYTFSSTDNTRVVNVGYSYLVTTINRQENDIVPAGKSISVTGVGSGSTVNGDLGVTYTATGIAFLRVATSTPTVTGTYYVSGSNPAIYKFATGDINALVTIGFTVNDPNAISPGQPTSLNYTLNNGTLSQPVYSFLEASYPDAAFGYTGIATLLYEPMDLGMGGELQENRFEVITYDIFGGGIQDCNPMQCVYQVLTNQQWGLGVGTIPFPVAAIDNGSSGTWGSAAAAGTSSTNSTAWNWFASQNMFISPCIDSQDTAASTISKWLEAGCCSVFVSEGLLKTVPYGDTSAAANGCTWTAPSAYITALDDTIFVPGKDGEDPVKTNRLSPHDAWNIVQIQWDSRLNQYAPEITPESDQGLINRWGERREDPQDYDFIHTVVAATFAANMRIKHNCYTRNQYEFTIPYTYSYLEPMDIVTISSTSTWAAGLNNVNLGLTLRPVRITKIVDDPEKGLQITAEDYLFGAHQPTIYNKQQNDSTPPANAYADPGNSEVVLFEPSDELTNFAGDQIWIGALGTSDNYGYTNILVSQSSGGPYTQVGSIKAPARLGVLASTFASGSDPDTVNSLVVNLAENCNSFEAGTTTDADFGNTICFVDGEIISYSALTYTGQSQVTFSSYIRRGQQGTAISSHAGGSLFLRLDNAIFKYNYNPAWRGETLWFKFQSVNAFGLMAQDQSTLTPVSFTLPGVSIGSVDAETGLVVEASLGVNASYRPLSNPLTAIDNGTAPQVNIAAFSMQVGASTVAYNSGSVTGTTGEYGQTVFIYFSDPNLAGGTVTYNLSTTRETALAGSTNFFLGSIGLPNSGGGATGGNNDGGTGGQYSRGSRILPETAATSGGGTWTTLSNVLDNDVSTYAQGVTTTGGTSAQLVLSGYPQSTGGFSTDTLTVVDRCSAITGSAPYLVEYSTNGGTAWSTLRSVTSADSTTITTTQNLNTTVNSSQVQVRFSLPAASGTISTTPTYAGLGADSGTGGAESWTTPTNAEGSGSTPTVSGPLSGSGNYATSHYLYLTDYGFSIPSSSTIIGISVLISHSSNSKSDADYSMDIYDNTIQLMKAGSPVGTNNANYNDWPTTQGSQPYGGSSYLWGTTWAYTDINNSGFGVAITVALSNDVHSGYENATGRVYWAQITVYYETGSGSSCTANIYDAAQVVSL